MHGKQAILQCSHLGLLTCLVAPLTAGPASCSSWQIVMGSRLQVVPLGLACLGPQLLWACDLGVSSPPRIVDPASLPAVCPGSCWRNLPGVILGDPGVAPDAATQYCPAGTPTSRAGLSQSSGTTQESENPGAVLPLQHTSKKPEPTIRPRHARSSLVLRTARPPVSFVTKNCISLAMESEAPPQQEREEAGQQRGTPSQEAAPAADVSEQPAASPGAVEVGDLEKGRQPAPPPAAPPAPGSKQKKPPACQVCGVDLSECRVFFRVSLSRGDVTRHRPPASSRRFVDGGRWLGFLISDLAPSRQCALCAHWRCTELGCPSATF